MESAICELRRAHPRWGQRRLRFELGRRGCPGPVPSLTTIYRVLVRHGLIDPVSRRRRREDYARWQRKRPTELWPMDIVGGVKLASGGEAKVVTGVDDHSRFCVITAVARPATGRTVCLAFAKFIAAVRIPDEMLTVVGGATNSPGIPDSPRSRAGSRSRRRPMPGRATGLPYPPERGPTGLSLRGRGVQLSGLALFGYLVPPGS